MSSHSTFVQSRAYFQLVKQCQTAKAQVAQLRLLKYSMR